MTLQNVRLLIVVKDTDYRQYLKAMGGTSAVSDDWLVEDDLFATPDPTASSLSATDARILNAATYWRSQLQDVAIFSAHSLLPYSVITPLGIRLIGSGLAPDSQDLNSSRPNPLVADFCPTHIVFCTTAGTVLSWANRNRIPSIALFWEWQEPLGRQQQRQHSRLLKQLNEPNVSWIGGHGLLACKILETSGISPRKLIPWEWSEDDPLEQSAPKQLRYDREAIELLYIGSVQDEGVLDLLAAVGHMQRQGTLVRLNLLCEASFEEENTAQNLVKLRSHIATQDLSEQITLLPMPQSQTTCQYAQEADLIVIPSAVAVAGLPMAAPSNSLANSAIQFARAARTPIVAADSPSIEGELFHGVNAMIFPAGNAKSMAHRIERIMSQPQLYAQISDALEITLDSIKIPARWTSLIDYWLNSASTMPAAQDSYQQLCNWAMSSGRYSQL